MPSMILHAKTKKDTYTLYNLDQQKLISIILQLYSFIGHEAYISPTVLRVASKEQCSKFMTVEGEQGKMLHFVKMQCLFHKNLDCQG